MFFFFFFFCQMLFVLCLFFFVSQSFLFKIMLFLLSFVFMSSLTAPAVALPHSAFDFIRGAKAELESSGSGPDEPVQGVVKVFPLDPGSLANSGFLRRGLSARRGLSLSTRLPFPAFLSQGRPGPAPAPALASKALASPLHHLQPKSEMELKKKQGLQMWQKALNKGQTMPVSLPSSLKDSRQTCSGVPFTQVRHNAFYISWIPGFSLSIFKKTQALFSKL